MEIKKTGMFCLNSALTRQDDITLGQTTGITMGKNQGEAAVITRVDNFELNDGQTVKIKKIHERAVAELGDVLGW